jgi:hypothetical protein
MNLSAKFPPHLSTHTTFGKTSCAVLGVCTLAIYPDTDKGTRGLPVNQHGSTNW